jgi:hypothetical protein
MRMHRGASSSWQMRTTGPSICTAAWDSSRRRTSKPSSSQLYRLRRDRYDAEKAAEMTSFVLGRAYDAGRAAARA